MTRLFVRSADVRGRREDAERHVGAFLGTVPGSLERGDAMERWLGGPLDCQTVFEPWDTRSEEIAAVFDRLTAVWDAGRTPLLTWEAFTPTPAATSDDVLARADEGAFGRYFAEWANALAEWAAGPDGELGTADDRRLYLRPLHEANGDWYPWAPAGGGFDPDRYVRVWHRLRRAVSRAGLGEDHVQWIWAVNHEDVGGTRAEDLYPGDDAVDLVGVDGFNWGACRSWGEWRTPEEVFGGMFDRVRAVSDRPVCVPEFGTTSATVEGNDTGRKNGWLRAAFEYFQAEGVVLAAYFDIEKETDWAVFGGSRGGNTVKVDGTRYQTYPGFRVGVRRFRDG